MSQYPTIQQAAYRLAEALDRLDERERGIHHEWDYLDDPFVLADRRGVVTGMRAA